MELRENASVEKLAGRYYTPYELANFIVNWGMDGNVREVLEPSCGDGVFLDALSQIEGAFRCTGIEIFEEEARVAEHRLLLDQRFEIVISDFYDAYMHDLQERRYQFIMGNPPYIRYQYLSEEQREIQSTILTQSGLKANKLINAWVAFIVATIKLMDEDSKVGLVIPAELLQVKYSEALRIHLMQQLNEITVVTFNELIFPDVEQEVVVLLGKKQSNFTGPNQIKILEFENVQDLNLNFVEINRSISFQDVDVNTSKWTKYFLNTEEIELVTRVNHNGEFIRFGTIASVDVGITTGNNNFFCVNHDTAEMYDLLNISRPLIARSVNIPGVTFDNNDWLDNIQRGAKTYLLDFNNTSEENLTELQRSYISLGEANGEHTGYKCRIREKWYNIPSIWVPDAFFLRRNYQYPKFVLNQNETVSTDTMHRVRFNLVDDPRRAILSYYNSVGFAFTELEARSYGGGVLEILPRELENVTIPNIIDLNIDDTIIEMLFNYLNENIRNGNNIELALDLIDSVLLVEHMNIDADLVRSFRGIWHKLKNRRIDRGANTETN